MVEFRSHYTYVNPKLHCERSFFLCIVLEILCVYNHYLKLCTEKMLLKCDSLVNILGIDIRRSTIRSMIRFFQLIDWADAKFVKFWIFDECLQANAHWSSTVTQLRTISESIIPTCKNCCCIRNMDSSIAFGRIFVGNIETGFQLHSMGYS